MINTTDMSLLSIDISWQVTAIVCVLIVAISSLLCVYMCLSTRKNNNIVDILGHNNGNDSMESKFKNDACSTTKNTMLYKIFISYKRNDKERVFNLKRLIELKTKVQCWVDLKGIESDAYFVNVIVNKINECDIFLFMYSKEHSKIDNYEDDWTIREVNFAKEKGKRIIFINMDKTALCDWLLFMFPNKQEVDASSKEALERLCEDIQKWVTTIK